MFKLRPLAGYGHNQIEFPDGLSDREGALHLRARKVSKVTLDELNYLRKEGLLSQVELLPQPSVSPRALRQIKAAQAAKELEAKKAAEAAAPAKPKRKRTSRKKDSGSSSSS